MDGDAPDMAPRRTFRGGSTAPGAETKPGGKVPLSNNSKIVVAIGAGGILAFVLARGRSSSGASSQPSTSAVARPVADTTSTDLAAYIDQTLAGFAREMEQRDHPDPTTPGSYKTHQSKNPRDESPVSTTPVLDPGNYGGEWTVPEADGDPILWVPATAPGVEPYPVGMAPPTFLPPGTAVGYVQSRPFAGNSQGSTLTDAAGNPIYADDTAGIAAARAAGRY